MVEKRQPPLWLDMSFAEALERFAGTDPKEADENAETEAAKKRMPDDPQPSQKRGRAARKRTRPG